MRQTFQEYIASKKMGNNQAKVREALLGRTVKVVGARNGHLVPLGTKIKVTSVANASVNYFYPTDHGNTAIYYYDIELVNDQTIADIVEEIAEQNRVIRNAEQAIDDLEIKKKFMVANKLEVFDEDQYKVYQVLQTLKGKKTDLEKSAVIAQLIKG